MIPADRERVEGRRIFVPRRHFDRFEMGVHLHVDACVVEKHRLVVWGLLRYKRARGNVPVMVPCTIEPSFSSNVTVSLFSFIKNLQTSRRPKVSSPRQIEDLDRTQGIRRNSKTLEKSKFPGAIVFPR